jgi:hypothetical protein
MARKSFRPPTSFEPIISLNTAKALGLALPKHSEFIRADEMIRMRRGKFIAHLGGTRAI